MDKQGFSVSEVNQYLKQLLESQSDLHHIPVMGEVSNFKRYASGHCYFTLKDEKSARQCGAPVLHPAEWGEGRGSRLDLGL